MEQVAIEVKIGEINSGFGSGDFLNAIHQICNHFISNRDISDKEIINSLKLYAEYIEETR